MHIYLVRIPHHKGRSIHRNVLASIHRLLVQATASTDTFELASKGGISIRRGGSDRTTFAESLFEISFPNSVSHGLLLASYRLFSRSPVLGTWHTSYA